MAAIEVQGLRKTFSNGHTALADISFTIPSGQFVCVVGRSGAGKSTLMRCLNASLSVTAGDARIGGTSVRDLTGSRRRDYQRSVGFIYQEFHLVGRLSALQNVLTGRLGHIPAWRAALGYFDRHDRETAIEALERVNMLHKAIQRTDSLSGGEKQRVAIARALAQEPLVLLADEPVANLDPELAEGVLRDLHDAARGARVTTLVNIHNIAQARRYADRIIGVAQGRVVFDGKPEHFDAAAEHVVYRFDQDSTAAVDLRRDLDPHVVTDLEKAMKRALKNGEKVPSLELPVPGVATAEHDREGAAE
jgi:phosphonate transport system ATP-binding protein